MRKIVQAILLAFFILILPINSHFSVAATAAEYTRVIDESFTINAHSYVTFNFTRTYETDEKEFWYYERVNGSIQTFFVDEENFNQFKNRQNFFEIDTAWNSEGIIFNEYPEKYLSANYSEYKYISQIGTIFLILNNIENYTVTGKCLLRHYYATDNSADISDEDPLEDLINNLINADGDSNDFVFLFARISLFMLIMIVVISLIIWTKRHSAK